MKYVTCKEVEPLLPASAAGALDGDDEQTVNAHLAQCRLCLAYLTKFQQAVEQLAYAVPQLAPPPNLRGKVLLAIAITPQAAEREVQRGPGTGRAEQAPTRPGSPLSRLRFRYMQLAPVGLAACLVLLVAAGDGMGAMAQQMTFMRDSVTRTQAVHDLLKAPATQMLTLKPSAAASSASGQVIVAPGQSQVAILATHLPTVPNGQGYGVWFVDHNSTNPPMHAGWLQPDDSGAVMDVISLASDPYRMAGLQITEDPLGSSSTRLAGTVLLEGWYR